MVQEKDDVRLGKGSMGFSIIHPDAEERAIAAMRRFQKIAKTRNASMRVVATCKRLLPQINKLDDTRFFF